MLDISPPVIKTVPLVRRVAEWRKRTLFKDPVGVKTPVAGSYNSAPEEGLPFETPPATRTLPLLRSVAVKRARVAVMLPVGGKNPTTGPTISAPAVTTSA